MLQDQVMVMSARDASTGETEAGRGLQVPGQLLIVCAGPVRVGDGGGGEIEIRLLTDGIICTGLEVLPNYKG